jgi:hypothetical protein
MRVLHYDSFEKSIKRNRPTAPGKWSKSKHGARVYGKRSASFQIAYPSYNHNSRPHSSKIEYDVESRLSPYQKSRLEQDSDLQKKLLCG